MSQQPAAQPTSLLPPNPTTDSPGDDRISPKSQAPPTSKPQDYFDLGRGRDKDKLDAAGPATTDHPQPVDKLPELVTTRDSISTAASPSISSTGDHERGEAYGSSNSGEDRSAVVSRKSSSASVTFRPPLNPSLPQGHQRSKRLRTSSPVPIR